MAKKPGLKTGIQIVDENQNETTDLVAKSSLVDADKIILLDSAASNLPKTALWSLIKSTLKTYFDTIYSNGSGSGTVNTGTQNRLAYYAANGTAVSESAAITANRALTSNANGLPVASAVTATEQGYLSGVTSAIQTQLDGKQAIPTYQSRNNPTTALPLLTASDNGKLYIWENKNPAGLSYSVATGVTINGALTSYNLRANSVVLVRYEYIDASTGNYAIIGNLTDFYTSTESDARYIQASALNLTSGTATAPSGILDWSIYDYPDVTLTADTTITSLANLTKGERMYKFSGNFNLTLDNTYFTNQKGAYVRGKVNHLTLKVSEETGTPEVVASWGYDKGYALTVTASTYNLQNNISHVIDSSGLCTLSLPGTSNFGDEIEVVGYGSTSSWKISLSGGITIIDGVDNVTLTTHLQSDNRWNNVKLKCVVPNTTWTIIHRTGNLGRS